MSKTIRKKLNNKSSKLAAQGTLAAVAGTMLLSEEASAQVSNLVSVTSLQGIASAQVQPDGSLLITTDSGLTYTLPAANFTSQGGQFLVPASFADDLSTWALGSASTGSGGISPALIGVGAAIATGIGIALAADGDDDDDVVAPVVEETPVVEVPVDPGAGTDGDDTFESDGSFPIDGGEGTDTVDFSGLTEAVNVDLDLNTPTPGPDSQDGAILDAPVPAGGAPIQELDNIENVIGTDFNDVIFGNNEVNVLQGGAGDDAFHSFGGADTIDGGEGTDTAIFTAAPVDIVVDLDDAGNATATGGETLISIENLTGSNAGNDTLSGNASDNVINGNAGNDTLFGEAGNDTLNGDDGDDILAGGGGTDVIDGGAGIDTNSFEGIGLGVTATVAADGTGTASYGQVNESFTGIENLTGTDNDDVLIATGAAANVLIGGDGDDIIAGGGGTDVLDGGAGNDTNSFQGIGVDVTANLATGTAVYTAPSGTVINETFTNFENLTGFTGNDTLIGDAGANVLTGGAGNDTLDGGDGIDTAVFEDVAANITVTNNGDGTLTVVSALDGTDTISNIENLVDSAGVALAIPSNVLADGTVDLSGVGAAPTAFTLIDGSNTVSNTVVNAAAANLPNAQDVDIFSVTVPTGSTLTSVELSQFVSADDVGFIGLVQGSSFPVDNAAAGVDTSGFLGLSLFGNGNPGDALTGTNILDALATGGNTGLTAGTDFIGFNAADGLAGGDTFTFLVQQLGNSPIDFTLDFDVSLAVITTTSAAPSAPVFVSAEDEAPIFADTGSVDVANDVFIDPADTIEDTVFVASDVFEVA